MTRPQLAKLLGEPDLIGQLNELDEYLGGLFRSNTRLDFLALEVLKGGGKRLRPSITILVGKGKKRPISSKLLAAAGAIELTHLASIVHDDIIDGSSYRRGSQSVVKKQGANTALLLGDLLIAKAADQAAIVGTSASKLIAATIAEMAQGQSIRVKNEKDYLESVRQKTGSLFAASCQLGLICCGQPDDYAKKLADYGLSLGSLFQVNDDLQDNELKFDATRIINKNKQSAALALSKLAAPYVYSLNKLAEYYYLQASTKAS